MLLVNSWVVYCGMQAKSICIYTYDGIKVGCSITISGSFSQNWKFRSSCYKGRKSNRDIERKYIQPRMRSYSYICFATQPERFLNDLL